MAEVKGSGMGRPGATTPLPAEQAKAKEELLMRLVALNAERAAEEARGLVRWLRPESQASSTTVGATVEEGATEAVSAAKKPACPRPFPNRCRRCARCYRRHP